MIENRSRQYVLDRFWDLDEPSTPDGVTADDLRAYTWSKNGNYNIRLTHQATQRHKFTWSYFQEPKSSLASAEFAWAGRTTPEAWYTVQREPDAHADGPLDGAADEPAAPRGARLVHAGRRQHLAPMDHGGVLPDAQDRLVARHDGGTARSRTTTTTTSTAA